MDHGRSNPARRWIAVLLGLVAALAAACGDGGEERARGSLVAPASAEDLGDLVPGDDEDVVLTTTGVAGAPISLTVDQIEQLERVRIVIDDPFELRAAEYTGVWLADLLDVLDVAADATMTFHALDDYTVTFARSDIDRDDALLATRADGERLEIVDGGPIRLVFADPDGVGRNPDLWIWSIDGLDVD